MQLDMSILNYRLIGVIVDLQDLEIGATLVTKIVAEKASLQSI